MSSEPAVVLSRLQSLLGKIYDVEPPLDVGTFLVTDRAVAARWAGAGEPRTDEALYLRESDEGLELALYIDGAGHGRCSDAIELVGMR